MAVSERATSFRYAPADWSESEAREWAESQGLDMDDDHWEVVYALQEYCSRHECNKYSVRELHDALDEKFHEKGAVLFQGIAESQIVIVFQAHPAEDDYVHFRL